MWLVRTLSNLHYIVYSTAVAECAVRAHFSYLSYPSLCIYPTLGILASIIVIIIIYRHFGDSQISCKSQILQIGHYVFGSIFSLLFRNKEEIVKEKKVVELIEDKHYIPLQKLEEVSAIIIIIIIKKKKINVCCIVARFGSHHLT